MFFLFFFWIGWRIKGLCFEREREGGEEELGPFSPFYASAFSASSTASSSVDRVLRRVNKMQRRRRQQRKAREPRTIPTIAPALMGPDPPASSEGVGVGSSVGPVVGAEVGSPVGSPVGTAVGSAVGTAVGSSWNRTVMSSPPCECGKTAEQTTAISTTLVVTCGFGCGKSTKMGRQNVGSHF